ncbi:hypothetical protein HQ38_07980 [Porphyromonas crevioricanis]|uniref:Transposase n=1 Tax=Porphyromonas crevioricanis TaxID=393921 RepID=A0AB34PEL8_9PORP|nr:hypothetical protein HQ38_07980 [Porphyromonas crevioricanis]
MILPKVIELKLLYQEKRVRHSQKTTREIVTKKKKIPVTPPQCTRGYDNIHSRIGGVKNHITNSITYAFAL